MKFSTFAERLLLYKVNRGIARGERTRIKERELEREFAGYQRANKELMMWAERYPDHPYLGVVSQEIERIDQDLRYTELTRGRKMGLAAVNGLRVLRGKLPQEEVKKYDAELLRKNLIGKGIGLAVLALFFLAVCHGPKTDTSVTTEVQSATPSATPNWQVAPTSTSSVTETEVSANLTSPTSTPEPTPTSTPHSFKHRHHR